MDIDTVAALNYLERINSYNSWFSNVADNDDLVEFVSTLRESLRLAQKDGKLLKIKVQEIDVEDTFF